MPLKVSPVFVMTIPDLGLTCAIVTVAETAHKTKMINFFIVFMYIPTIINYIFVFLLV